MIRFRKTKIKDRFGNSCTIYQAVEVEDANIIVAEIFPWYVYYFKRYFIYSPVFKKNIYTEYIAVFVDKETYPHRWVMLEGEKLREIKKWLQENWDSESFSFRNTAKLPTAFWIPGEEKLKARA